MRWEALVPAVVALLGYAGFCYARHETILRDGRRWISDYLNVIASRQREALGEVLRDVLPEVAVSYFSLPPSEPPMSDAELAAGVQSIRAEADANSKAYTFRDRITKPIVGAAVREIVGAITELGDVGLTPGGESALLNLQLSAVDTAEAQRRLVQLEGWYLLETVLSAVAALLLIVAGITQSHSFLVAGVAAILLLAPFIVFVEFGRGALRRSLDVERTNVELREAK